jgi:hypothetical protein
MTWRTDILLGRLLGYEDIAEQIEEEIRQLRNALVQIDGLAVAKKRGAIGEAQKIARYALARLRKTGDFAKREDWI